MQDIIETIKCGDGKTLNVFGPAWHSGEKRYLTRKEWARKEGSRVTIYRDRHHGARHVVPGFCATVGNGYGATIATAHRRCDLVLWVAALSGMSADCMVIK